MRNHSALLSLICVAACVAACGNDSNEAGTGESIDGGLAGDAGTAGAPGTGEAGATGTGNTAGLDGGRSDASSSGGSDAGGTGGLEGDGGTGGDSGRGGDGGSAGGGGQTDGGDAGQGSVGAFTITSTTLANGAMFPMDATCETTLASSQMPQLMWTNPPAGTMSFAIMFVDTTLVGMTPPNTNGFHSALWDIPANVSMLPQGLPAGSPPAGSAGLGTVKQKKAPSGMAYLGPCPNFPSTVRTKTDEYAFRLYALPVATLPSNTSSMTIQQIQTAIMAVPPLGMAVLIGSSNAAGTMLK